MATAQSRLEIIIDVIAGKGSGEINRVIQGMGSLESSVSNYQKNLISATPQNLKFAQTFEQIRADVNSGKMSIDDAKIAVGSLKQEMDAAGGETEKMGVNWKNLAVTALAVGAAIKTVVGPLFEFTKESTLLAARVETLGIVTEIMGRNAGYSAEEVGKLEAGIQSMGITTQASRQSLAQMMRAEIDLAKATDLARLAQDAAVVSGENSSEAFEKLTQIIGTGNTFMARGMGLLVDFEGAYKSLADSLGKPVDSLTQLEKVQARTNEVMAQGATIAGAYEAAMETAGKQLLSYPRYLEELKLAFGEGFQDIFSEGIITVTEFTKNLGEAMKAENLLKDAAEAGIISRLEANQLINKATWTTYTFAEAIKYLEKVERDGTKVQYEWNEAVDKAIEWGIRWDDLVDQIRDGTIDGAEATLILNERLEEQIPALEGIASAASDADAAMLGYAAAVQDGTMWTWKGEEAFTRYGEAQAFASGRAEEGANAALVARKAQQAYTTQLEKAKKAMDNLDMSLINTIETWKEQITWFTGGGAEIQAAAEAAWETWIGSQKTEADKAAFETAVNNAEIAFLDLQMELDLMSAAEAEAELVKLGYPIETAIAIVAELQASLYALTSQPYRVNVEVQWNDPGWEWGGSGPPAPPAGARGGDDNGGDDDVPYIGDYQHGTGGWRTVPAGGGFITMDPGEKFNVVPQGQSGGAGKTVNIYQTNYITPTDQMSSLTVQTMLEQEALTALAQAA